MTRFAARFAVLLIAMFAIELTPLGQTWLVDPFTQGVARLSAATVQLFDGGVHAFGNILQDRDNGFAVAIEAGCNGVEAAIVLTAAMFAFPSSWRMKAIGIAAGLFAAQSLNVLRIISLFYLGQWNRPLFELAHLYVWQSLIILDVLVVFLVWLRYLDRGPASDHAAPSH